MNITWRSRPIEGQGPAYSFRPQWDGLEETDRSWAIAQLSAGGWLLQPDLFFYFHDVETPEAMLREADRILIEAFGILTHEQDVPHCLLRKPLERRIISQGHRSKPLASTLIVFHWQRSYSNANRLKAAVEMREPTMEEVVSDGEMPPRYFFTAYRVPEGSSAERQSLRELLASSGFEKRNNRLEWMAIGEGDEPALRLKMSLEAAGVDAIHYHDVPAPLIVPATVDGLL